MADVVIYLELGQMVSSDLRTLRIYKMRGGPYTQGRHTLSISDDGIDFIVA